MTKVRKTVQILC